MNKAAGYLAIRRLWENLASLKLTIVCLAFLMILVVLCTLAQVHLGTYLAVKTYIRSLFVYVTLPGTHWRIPIFPGGGLVGTLLLINLTISQFLRLEMSWRKAGLWLAHGGLIFLFLGEFITSFFAVETQMAIEEGSAKNYIESYRDTELAIIDATDSRFDEVISIPQSLFSRKAKIKIPQLPCGLIVKRYYPNSFLKMGSGENAAQGKVLNDGPPAFGSGSGPKDGAGVAMATSGIGTGISVSEAPATTRDDERNIVSALVEVVGEEGSLGTWLVSSGLGAPQSFSHKGHTYRIGIRPMRHYLPFSITLKDFRHDVYPGTDIPKNFSSLVRLNNKETGEDRDALIYMNHPLRYGGKTFYQASFGKEDTLSVFQVVENPGWLLPYISCTLVGLGLLIHFIQQLRLN